MKAIFFLFVTTFLFCSSSYGQEIDAKIIVNGDSTRHHFSRSEQNIIVVEGIGCERFELRGTGVSLIERSGNYHVQVNTTGLQANITITCVSNGKRMTLGTYTFLIVD
jgi:hypothetical protein